MKRSSQIHIICVHTYWAQLKVFDHHIKKKFGDKKFYVKCLPIQQNYTKLTHNLCLMQ